MNEENIKAYQPAPTIPEEANEREGLKTIRIKSKASDENKALLEIEGVIDIPQAGKDSAIVVRDLSKGLFRQSLVGNNGVRIFKKIIAEKQEKEDILFCIDQSDTVYNRLSVFDKKFIIALQILLSDLTKDRRKVLEDARNKNRENEPLEIPNFLKGIDINGLPPVIFEFLKFNGFSDEDIVVIIPGRDYFLKKYLGYTTIGGTERAKFIQTLNKLRRGLLAWIWETKEENQEKLRFNSHVQIIQKYQSFIHKRKGGKREISYYVFSLHPILTYGIGNNYKTIPKNNAEIFHEIGDNEVLFTLYDKILTEASYNFVAINKRGDIHYKTISEDEILKEVVGKDNKEIINHRKRLLDTIYNGLRILYDKGLLAEPITPPTKEERQTAKENGKDIYIKLAISRKAFS